MSLPLAHGGGGNGSAPEGRRTAPPADRNRWTVLAIVCAALLVVVIDITVLHVAAPAMTEDLEPSAVGLLWIIDIYPLVVAPLLVASGTLGDRLGRKRVMLVGLLVFGAASGVAAFAPSTGVLIAARALMAVGGAMILPATMAIVRDVFPDRRERQTAVGIWSAVFAGGAVVGPLVGGFLVERWWWGSVFLINVPIVLIVAPVALLLMPESRAADPPPWDTTAVVLAALGILGIAFGIKEGARHGFADPLALGVMLAGVAALTTFVRRQLARERPLLDVRLFSDRAFSVAVGCVMLSMFALIGLELFFAQYLQLVLGLEPLAAALRLMPLMVASFVGSLMAAPLLRRVGTRGAMVGGLGLTTLGMIPLLTLGVEDEYWRLWPSFVAMGLLLDLALVAANDVILSAVPADRAGGAAAIEETAYELGGGLGVAVLGSILAAVYSGALPAIDGVGAADERASEESIGRAAEVAGSLPGPVGDALTAAARHAFVDGLHAVLVVGIVLMAGSALLAGVALRRRGGGTVSAPAQPREPSRETVAGRG